MMKFITVMLPMMMNFITMSLSTMIIMITAIQHVSEDFTILILIIIMMVIIPIHTGTAMTRITGE